MIIALDGPAAAGKGTLARRLSHHLNIPMLDTGALYRATGVAVLRAGGDPKDPKAAEAAAKSLTPGDTVGPQLRTEEAGAAASNVAAIPAVRAALLAFQRDFAHQPGGAVLDGRDIGTVVVPGADVKLYVTASAEIRAERRFQELRGGDATVTYAAVLEDLEERDRRDRERSTAPLKPADDAMLLDTSTLDADQAFAAALRMIEDRRVGRRPD